VFSVIKNNPVSVMLAVLLHILIVAFLVFGFDWSKVRKPATSNANVVQAHTVDAKQLDQSKEKEKAAQRETLRREALKRKQAEEKKRQQQLEQKRIAKEKAERQKQDAERKRQAKLKKEREAKEAMRKAEEKRLAALEAKRKAEAKHKAEEEARRKAELERKRKAELEAKRRAEAKRKAEAAAQAERERALQDQLAAEQNSREIDRYVAVIKQQIERNWLKPGQAAKGLACIVQVRLIPGGDVIPGGVSIVSSSGNAAFDRSVETAVYKAAPLQVPSGPLFESFRTLRLKFKPSS
jgi:colicin import membrane protein